MTMRALVPAALITAGLLSAGCRSAPDDPRADIDPFYLLEAIALQDVQQVEVAPGNATGYSVRTFLRRDDTTVTAPWITIYAGQRANVTVLNQTTFIQDFDVEVVESKAIADPIVGIMQEGVIVEVLVQPADEPGYADIGFRVVVADLKTPIPVEHVHLLEHGPGGQIQLPRMAVARAVGAARVELGTTTRVALLQLGGDGETVVLLRVDEADIGMLPPGDMPDFAGPDGVGPDGEDVDLASLAASAAQSGRLRLDAVRLDGHLDAGVMEEGAARSFGLRDASPLRRLEVLVAPRAGSSISDQFQESYVANYDVQVTEAEGGVTYDPIIDTLLLGLTATVQDDGRLMLLWKSAPSMRRVTSAKVAGRTHVDLQVPDVRTHSRLVDLRSGRRVVPLARLPDGGTLAIVVDYQPAVRPTTALTAAPDLLLPAVARAAR